MSRRGFTRTVSHQPSRPTIVIAALAAMVVMFGLTYVALVAPRGVPGLKYYELDAQFDDAAQIADLSEVRMAGRHVGQVTSSELKNGHASVRLQLFPGQGPLPADTTARIRLKGLLGAKFVDITPGKDKRTIPNNGTLPAGQTSTAVELLDVLQALDAPTRGKLQTTVKGLGEGLLGRGDQLNDMLVNAPSFLGDVQTVSGAILSRPGSARRFFPSIEKLTAAYDPVREDLATGFEPQARVLEAFVARRDALDQTLVVAPPSLRALHQGMDAATPLLNETAGLARATKTLTDDAPSALRATVQLLHHAEPALHASTPLLDKLDKATSPTLAFLHRAVPIISPSIKALHNNIAGLLTIHQHGCDILNFGKNWRSTLGYGVAPNVGDFVGDLDAGQKGLGPLNSLRVVAVRLSEVESLNADAPGHPTTIGRNAYPEPCTSITERR
jgi:virulence factor Mce-like protein